ncbi:LysR substrate-binding domain-containing protein [Halomonas sp. WWR20]
MRIERLPLNALRAFAEAAREGSFKLAASHLGVTPGAVSRQIKQLESRLGMTLFDRHPNGVSVNDAGRQLAEDVDAGLERIAAGIRAAGERSKSGTRLTLSVPPSFAQLWLLPRLAEFEAAEGRVEISLDASQALTVPTWQGESARIAIRYGRGPWPGVRSQRLFGDELFPVCAPALVTNEPQLTEPADLVNHTLLEVAWCSRQSEYFPGWHEWLEAAGAADLRVLSRRRYSLFGLALDQAIAGRGVVLASHPIVADRLASGVLVRPFGANHVLASPFTYDLILPASGTAPPMTQRFIEWLIEKAAEFRRDTLC